MGFTQRLRMNNIFPGSLNPPDMQGMAFDPMRMLPDLLQRQHNAEIQDFNEQHNKPIQQAQPALNHVAEQVAKPPMNVVYHPEMTPFQSASLEQDRNELASKDRLAIQKIKTSDENADLDRAIKEKRAQTYDFKANHPGQKLIAVKGGNVVAFDPITGSHTDTGVSSGTLTDKQRLEIQNSNAIGQIDERTKGNLEVQGVRGNQALEQIGARVNGTMKVNAAKPEKPESSTQQRTHIANTATELKNTRPDLANFITVNSDGTVSVTPSGNSSYFGVKGPTPEQAQEINSRLYPNSDSTTNSTSSTTTPSAPEGWKYVPKAGGGWTAVKVSGGE